MAEDEDHQPEMMDEEDKMEPPPDQQMDDVKINRFLSGPGRGRGFPRGPRYVYCSNIPG